MNVTLPDHPSFPTALATPDPGLLDELATAYATRAGADPVMAQFLFGEVPIELFDRVFAASDPAAVPVGAFLWLFHLSGYFGGLWLRGELARSGHNDAIVSFSVTPSAESFDAASARARAALAAAAAPRDELLAWSRSALFDTPDPDHPETPERGLVDTFGYNEGYLLQIVEAPPAGLAGPSGFVTCPSRAADGPLRCEYATNRLAALGRFAPVAAALAAGTGAYAGLAAEVAPVQDAGVARGRAVWDGLLDVQGFTQDAYEQLLDISSAFLETVQATALGAVRAVAEADELSGRRAAVATACLHVWLGSYLVGLTDGRDGRTLPAFAAGD